MYSSSLADGEVRAIRKRISILTLGSRGDVQPYVALGGALQARGCAVQIVTLEPFRDLVTGFGLDFRPVSDPLAAVKTSDYWISFQSSRVGLSRKLHALREVLKQSEAALLRMLDECFEACQQSDAIVSALTGFGGPHIAEKLRVPWCWAYLQPVTPTRVFPHYLTPSNASVGAFLNRATYSIADATFRGLFRSTLVAWRSTTLRLPRAFTTAPGRMAPLVLCGFSRFVIPKPFDWDEATHVTGYWFLDSPKGSDLPPEVDGFLAEEPRPICICLPAMARSLDAPAALDLILRVLQKTSQRALIITGGMIGEQGSVSNAAYAIPSAPHDLLFPRVRAVIHHGGAGTTASALLAQRPSIMVPSFFDQAFWSNLMKKLGVAPAPLFPHRLCVKNVAGALSEVIHQSHYFDNAARLGAKIKNEDGANRAAVILLQQLGFAWKGVPL